MLEAPNLIPIPSSPSLLLMVICYILSDYCSLLDIPITPTTQSGFYEIHIVQSPLLQTSLNNDIFDIRVIGRRIYAAVVDAHLPDSFGNQNQSLIPFIR